jgi:hypothetical protein
MMEPVDLTNLRDMIDDDRVMEKLLFEEFLRSCEVGIGALEAHLHTEDAEAWRKEAHALKGIALNLGAAELGGLFLQAQDDFSANAEAKNRLLQTIRIEYRRVEDFLLQAMAKP